MVSIITINYKSVDCLRRLIKSIQSHHKTLDWELIIINNSPEEQEAVAAITQFSNIKVLQSGLNLYFAPSINHATNYCSGEYLVFLNVDAYFEKPALNFLIEFLENHDPYGATVGKIINASSHTVALAGNMLPTISDEIIRNTFLSLLSKFKLIGNQYDNYLYAGWDRLSDKDIEAGCDAFLAIRKNVFLSCGGYTKNMLMYLTEEDLGNKLKKNNLKIRYLASAEIIHDWSHSTKKSAKPKIKAITLWDRYFYFQTHHGTGVAWLIVLLTIIGNPYLATDIIAILQETKKLSREAKTIAKYLNDSTTQKDSKQ